MESHGHDNHNGHENISSKNAGEEPFLIRGPGEYEIQDISVIGIKSFHDSQSGKKQGLNTIYMLNWENVNICHLGDLGEKELRPEVLDLLGEVDLLFVPISGDKTIGTEEALKIINQIEPRLVIPMHYGDNKKLTEFLKEIGQEKIEQTEKLTFKKKDILEKKGEVVVLKPLLN